MSLPAKCRRKKEEAPPRAGGPRDVHPQRFIFSHRLREGSHGPGRPRNAAPAEPLRVRKRASRSAERPVGAGEGQAAPRRRSVSLQQERRGARRVLRADGALPDRGGLRDAPGDVGGIRTAGEVGAEDLRARRDRRSAIGRARMARCPTGSCFPCSTRTRSPRCAPDARPTTSPETREREAVGKVSSIFSDAGQYGWGFNAPVAGRYRIRLKGYSVWVSGGGIGRWFYEGQGAEKAPVYWLPVWHRPNADEIWPGRNNEPIGIYAQSSGQTRPDRRHGLHAEAVRGRDRGATRGRREHPHRRDAALPHARQRHRRAVRQSAGDQGGHARLRRAMAGSHGAAGGRARREWLPAAVRRPADAAARRGRERRRAAGGRGADSQSTGRRSHRRWCDRPRWAGRHSGAAPSAT